MLVVVTEGKVVPTPFLIFMFNFHDKLEHLEAYPF